MTITGSTISNNTAESRGGGIRNKENLTLTNCTIGGNTAGNDGGGIESDDTLSMTNCTISGNMAGDNGGGIRRDGGRFRLQNTIIAGNQAGNNGPDCHGSIISLGHNLIGISTHCNVRREPETVTDIVDRAPGLKAFVFGLSGTGHFPLMPISPAVDAGHEAACPPTDQLGQARVGACDIGAIELIVSPFDFDGDGQTDIAVYNPPTAEWFISRGQDRVIQFEFGFPGVIPIPADYDGDGQTDVAVYNPPTSEWFISRSQAGFTQFEFGFASVIPIATELTRLCRVFAPVARQADRNSKRDFSGDELGDGVCGAAIARWRDGPRAIGRPVQRHLSDGPLECLRCRVAASSNNHLQYRCLQSVYFPAV
ncbi:FG-GAP repeat domain-containing protein [Candidatus Entotheonella palauensis]|uniref:FG-GAP repeat domain-containing protein n=1 Tax=Candidatus Entotheonella palauensis TaxID=93172 RepID=UPI000B7E1130|nr:VCBS repeat-containing protein [Candidatus Entotheonella palauensis]